MQVSKGTTYQLPHSKSTMEELCHNPFLESIFTLSDTSNASESETSATYCEEMRANRCVVSSLHNMETTQYHYEADPEYHRTTKVRKRERLHSYIKRQMAKLKENQNEMYNNAIDRLRILYIQSFSTFDENRGEHRFRNWLNHFEASIENYYTIDEGTKGEFTNSNTIISSSSSSCTNPLVEYQSTELSSIGHNGGIYGENSINANMFNSLSLLAPEPLANLDEILQIEEELEGEGSNNPSSSLPLSDNHIWRTEFNKLFLVSSQKYKDNIEQQQQVMIEDLYCTMSDKMEGSFPVKFNKNKDCDYNDWFYESNGRYYKKINGHVYFKCDTNTIGRKHAFRRWLHRDGEREVPRSSAAATPQK